MCLVCLRVYSAPFFRMTKQGTESCVTERYSGVRQSEIPPLFATDQIPLKSSCFRNSYLVIKIQNNFKKVGLPALERVITFTEKNIWDAFSLERDASDRAACMASGLGLWQSMVAFWFPAGPWDLSIIGIVQTGSGAQPASYSTGIARCVIRDRAAEAWKSPLVSLWWQVKNKWSPVYIIAYVFIACMGKTSLVRAWTGQILRL